VFWCGRCNVRKLANIECVANIALNKNLLNTDAAPVVPDSKWRMPERNGFMFLKSKPVQNPRK